MKYLASTLALGLLVTALSVHWLAADTDTGGTTASATVASTAQHEAKVARGVVFHDVNGNKKYDDGEKTLPGVRVSNGRDITTTDQHGQYELPVDDDTILFVIKPRGWRTPLSDTMLPRFYYIHKPKGSPPNYKYKGVEPTGPLPESVNFPLYPQDEPNKFRAIMFGDPQPRDQKELDYIAHDVVEELIGTDAAFGVTLGDIVFDRLSLFESQARTIALIGIPWYNVVGNHDINFDARHDKHSNETFQRHFGPAYYSFDYGPAHFIVVDNIEWYVREGERRGRYRGGLGEEQLAFIKNDLAGVPDDKLVVLMMHIPLVGVHDRQELYRLIEKRKFCMSISGHTHHHEHRFIEGKDGWRGPEPHHHVINVTVSGSWWSGAPDERGIPHSTMADGAPNGYSILSFDGNQYKLDFKAAGRPTSYQMQIHAPEVVTAGEAAKTDIYVNVFNGSNRSTVRMRIDDGEWVTMKQVRRNDPGYEAVHAAEKRIKNKAWRDLPSPKSSSHLWHAHLPDELEPGTRLIRIETVDMHGRRFTDERVIRIAPAAE